MKRYNSKRERKYGQNLQIKGERSLSAKAAFRRRPFAPGQAGKSKFRRRLSEYGRQLAEKQKLRISYGLKERQFRNVIQKAMKSIEQTDLAVMRILEKRLDNVVLKMGVASSRAQARQLVVHGHILVNGRKTNIPSYSVKKGDVISLKKKLQESSLCKDLTLKLKNYTPPTWISLDKKQLEAKIVNDPQDKDLETSIDLPQVIEFYSR
jgi:small subunit ribosomal protein S4